MIKTITALLLMVLDFLYELWSYIVLPTLIVLLAVIVFVAIYMAFTI